MLGTVQKGNYAHFYLCINLPMYKSSSKVVGTALDLSVKRSLCIDLVVRANGSSHINLVVRWWGILLSVSAKKVIIDKSN